MDRVTRKYAEQQMARLAKVLGKRVHYIHQGGKISGPRAGHPDQAEPGTYGEANTWVLDASAAGGWLTIYEYAGNGTGGLHHAIPGDGSHKAQEIWDMCRFAMDVLAMTK